MEQQSDNVQPTNILMFRAALSIGFQDIVKSLSKEDFINSLTILKSRPSVISKLHDIMVKGLHTKMNEDLEDIVQDENLLQGLRDLSKLIEKTTTPAETCAWRPPGDVKLHMRSLDMVTMKEEREKLLHLCDKLESENKVLQNNITERRKKTRALEERMVKLLETQSSGFSQLETIISQTEEAIINLQNQ